MKNNKNTIIEYLENLTDKERLMIQFFAGELYEYISKIDENKDSPLIIRIEHSHKLLDISNEFFDILKSILYGVSRGRYVSVEPYEKEINVEEAAEIFFHLAPRHVEELLEKSEITYRQQDDEKLMKLIDVVNYDKKLRIRRRKALEEMVRMSQEMGLYDMYDNPLVKKYD